MMRLIGAFKNVKLLRLVLGYNIIRYLQSSLTLVTKLNRLKTHLSDIMIYTIDQKMESFNDSIYNDPNSQYSILLVFLSI